MLFKTIRFALRLLLYAFLFLLIVVNFRLYLPSPLASEATQLPPTILKQLASSRAALEQGSPAQMQSLFPEGYVFSYLFHGLTWVEVGLRDPQYRDQAIREAQWAMKFVDSEKGREAFPELPPDHGMFYSAWRADLAAGIFMLQNGSDPNWKAELQQQCDAIADVLLDSPTTFPPSYVGASWPCDTFPGIHAMATYDHVTQEARYQDVIDRFKRRSKSSIDNKTGLISHFTDYQTGEPLSPARATSQTVILRTMPDIDPELAKQQYKQFRSQFFQPLIGLPSVLEFPRGTSGGLGDVDSGPLIAGRSLSATVMAIGLAQIYGDKAWSDAIAQTGEAIGCPLTFGGKRTYAFGLVPIGEQIVAYSYVAKPWFATAHQVEDEFPLSKFWRLPFHFLSLAIFAFAIWLIRRRKKPLAAS